MISKLNLRDNLLDISRSVPLPQIALIQTYSRVIWARHRTQKQQKKCIRSCDKWHHGKKPFKRQSEKVTANYKEIYFLTYRMTIFYHESSDIITITNL
jgi:hypothetical protein